MFTSKNFTSVKLFQPYLQVEVSGKAAITLIHTHYSWAFPIAIAIYLNFYSPFRPRLKIYSHSCRPSGLPWVWDPHGYGHGYGDRNSVPTVALPAVQFEVEVNKHDANNW